jgi:peptidoglycan/xylan/chitin deacetylase (PgdA/CDA1 family)
MSCQIVHSLALLADSADPSCRGASDPNSRLSGSVVRYTSRSKDIALTFDDGPNPAATPQILDLLNRYSICATFFVIGRFVRECPYLVREMTSLGHALGNHTDTHPALTFLSARRVYEELSGCQDAIMCVAGVQPRWMRPPFGLYGPRLRGAVLRAGLQGIAMWCIDCGDWIPQPDEQLIASLAHVGKNRDRGGDIVLLHDGDHRALNGDRRHVVGALKYWIPRWLDAGHQFVTIGQQASGPEAR